MAASAALSRTFPQSPPKPRGDIYRQVAQEFRHYVRSLPREPLCEEPMAKRTGANPRTFQHSTGWLKDRRSIATEVQQALTCDFDHLKARNKEIARAAAASPRTVEAWTDGTNLPGLEYFLRLVPHSPSLQKMLMRLMSFDADTDPEYHRAFIEFMNAVQRSRRP